eukprot:6734023-Pyramimonas_sp.AAC.1
MGAPSKVIITGFTRSLFHEIFKVFQSMRRRRTAPISTINHSATAAQVVLVMEEMFGERTLGRGTSSTG